MPLVGGRWGLKRPPMPGPRFLNPYDPEQIGCAPGATVTTLVPKTM